MSLNSVLRSLACMAYAASASPFTGAENQISRISLPLNVSHSTSPSILSTPPSSVSTKSALNITCDGAQYGDNLNVADCKDARDYIGSGPFEFAWVERTHFLQKPHFWLPYRYMGDIGHCYIEMGLAEGYDITYASLNQVKTAANAIMSKCGADGTLQGGTVSNIGDDRGLTMVLGTYHAAFECRGAFAPRETCFSIMDDMRASRTSQTFAPRTDPAAQVRLPAIIPARDGQSLVRVLGKSDTTSWYRIWEAVMLVYSVCARKGRGGIVTGLGDHGNLFVTMTAQTGVLSE